MKEIRQAMARGYCTKRNEKKILDPDLIEDMAIEVELQIKKVIDKRNIVVSKKEWEGMTEAQRNYVKGRNNSTHEIGKLFEAGGV